MKIGLPILTAAMLLTGCRFPDQLKPFARGARDTASEIVEDAEKQYEAAKERVESSSDQVGDKAGEATEKAQETGQSAWGSAQAAKDQAADKLSQIKADVTNAAEKKTS